MSACDLRKKYEEKVVCEREVYIPFKFQGRLARAANSISFRTASRTVFEVPASEEELSHRLKGAKQMKLRITILNLPHSFFPSRSELTFKVVADQCVGETMTSSTSGASAKRFVP